MDSTFEGLPEPMSGQSADFLGVSASELEGARKRREESSGGTERHMHEVRFVNNYSTAIVEEVGGDVRVFALSDISCLTAMGSGDYRVKLSGGEVFYVLKEDFEKLVSNTFGFSFRVDAPWD